MCCHLVLTNATYRCSKAPTNVSTLCRTCLWSNGAPSAALLTFAIASCQSWDENMVAICIHAQKGSVLELQNDAYLQISAREIRPAVLDLSEDPTCTKRTFVGAAGSRSLENIREWSVASVRLVWILSANRSCTGNTGRAQAPGPLFSFCNRTEIPAAASRSSAVCRQQHGPLCNCPC